MTLGGVGLGFIMPNLTIFSQELSGRNNLGIVTALVQSIRMIGGMLGTAIIGTMVNYYYVAGIQADAKKSAPRSWFWRCLIHNCWSEQTVRRG